MAGETDLATIIGSLTVGRRPEPVTVCTVDEAVAVGDGVLAVLAEAEATTVVATVATAEQRGWPVEWMAAWLTIEVHTSLDAVGLTAALSAALAERAIPCNVLAGYHHDHLLVPLDRADDAVAAIEALAPGDDAWAEAAESWDDEDAVRAYAAAAFDSLLATLADRGLSLAGAAVCDFGCGTGLLTERIAGEADTVDAVDSSPAMLARLRAKVTRLGLANVRPAEAPPEGPATHDLVVCSSVLGFVDDYPGTVARLVGLLRPGGVFVQWDWEREDGAPAGDGLSRDDVRRALAAAGLADVSVDTGFEVAFEDVTMRPLLGVGTKP